MNGAGSCLFEPAGSVHTVVVPADDTEETLASFVIKGLNIDPDDVGVFDVGSALRQYRASGNEPVTHGRRHAFWLTRPAVRAQSQVRDASASAMR